MLSEARTALILDGDTLLSPMDCYVVDVEVESSRVRPIVRYFIDSLSGSVTVEDCARASRLLRRHFEETGRFGDDYAVEVSSPGLERRVARRRDFERFIGEEIRIKSKTPIGDRRKLVGIIKHADDAGVTLVEEDEQYLVTYANIARANLTYEFTSGEE